MRSYVNLLRANPQYARLWLAQAISLLGDWFNTIVLSALVTRYSANSGLAISLLLLARFLPPLIFSPVAGVLLDRYDRRKILILSDLLRAAIVLGFLLVDSPGELWLIYALTVLQFSIGAVFEPGRAALMPSLVQRDDLVRANILGSITWSAMLAIGGATGGLVAALLGTEFALIFDSGTFLLSAALIMAIRPPAQPLPAERSAGAGSGLRDYLDGLRYAVRNPATGLALLIKAGGNFGNIDTILVVFATYLFVVGQDGTGSLGVLWSAFGVGAVIGPLIVDRFNDRTIARMRRLVLVGYAMMTIAWVALGAAPTLLIAAAAVLLKAMGGSVYWTYSSVIIQRSVDDAYLGRLFSLDMALFQLATALSIVITGAALEALGNEAIRVVTLGTAVVSLIPLLIWGLAVRWIEGRERAAPVPAGD
ncbi:MAG: MFS transporter [Candidatus Flexifilum sp.]|jgi:MFS family permease